MKTIIKADKAPEPIGPYNQAILVDNTLYVSGQIPLTLDGSVIIDDIKEATVLVMENIGAILHEAGMDFSNIIKSTIYTTQLSNFDRINEAYGSFFKKDYPVRETVQVVKLPKGATVEISVVAVK